MVNCNFHSKRNTAKYPKHFCKECNWNAVNSVQNTPFLRWTVDGEGWSLQISVLERDDCCRQNKFPSFISFQWCPLKMPLTKMTGTIGQPWHKRCPSRLLGKGFLLCNTLPSYLSTTLSPTLPPWVCKKDDLLKPCKEPSLLTGFLCKPNYIHKGWEGGERKSYMGVGMGCKICQSMRLSRSI